MGKKVVEAPVKVEKTKKQKKKDKKARKEKRALEAKGVVEDDGAISSEEMEQSNLQVDDKPAAVEETKQQPAKKAAPSSSGSGWQPRQVFVSGIPYTATEDQLKAFFGEHASAVGEIKMPKFQDSGRCIGYAHVLMTNEAAYNHALSMDRQSLGGRYLDIKAPHGVTKVDFKTSQQKAADMAENMPSDCKTLFIKGLPYSFKEDDIGDRFRRFGEIKAIRIAYNWQTKESKGFAYLQFEEHESAKTALLKMNGREVQGRQITVDFDSKGQAKSSYHLNTETERNRLYNREPIKEAISKKNKKEREKDKMTKIKRKFALDGN